MVMGLGLAMVMVVLFEPFEVGEWSLLMISNSRYVDVDTSMERQAIPKEKLQQTIEELKRLPKVELVRLH